MKITKIEQQAKAKDRYSVYVDDKFWLGVGEEVLIHFALHKGQILDQAAKEKIQAAEFNHKVYSQAIHYLSYGLRSIKEVKDYLAKGRTDRIANQASDYQDDQVVDAVIDKLIDQGYLNDLAYGQSYVRTLATVNRKGSRQIYRDLIAKGLSDHEIEEALLEYSQDQEIENLNYQAEKYARSKKKLTAKMLSQKLKHHLMAKGFPNDLINAYLSDRNQENSESEEHLLEEMAAKEYRKRSRRDRGWTLKQKLVQALYRKGFNMDQIQTWINQHEDLFIED
ncbi:RecX family transcriptional regulator [Hutsoniella sourekii]